MQHKFSSRVCVERRPVLLGTHTLCTSLRVKQVEKGNKERDGGDKGGTQTHMCLLTYTRASTHNPEAHVSAVRVWKPEHPSLSVPVDGSLLDVCWTQYWMVVKSHFVALAVCKSACFTFVVDDDVLLGHQRVLYLIRLERVGFNSRFAFSFIITV